MKKIVEEMKENEARKRAAKYHINEAKMLSEDIKKGIQWNPHDVVIHLRSAITTISPLTLEDIGISSEEVLKTLSDARIDYFMDGVLEILEKLVENDEDRKYIRKTREIIKKIFFFKTQ